MEDKEIKHHWQVLDSLVDINNDTPLAIWKLACKYFAWCDANPVITKKTALVGKEAGKKFQVEQIRPYNIKAFCLHANISEEYLKDIRNSKDEASDWYVVVSKILYIIYVQNYEMAQLDIFNPTFTSKVLNMDRDDSPIKPVQIQIISAGIPTLSNSENEILEKLELENRDLEIPKDKNL